MKIQIIELEAIILINFFFLKKNSKILFFFQIIFKLGKIKFKKK